MPNLLARLNCFLQRKNADFNRLSIILDSVLCESENLKKDGAEWCSQVELCMTNDHCISIRNTPTHRGQTVPATVNQYRDSVAAPCIDGIISNIKSRFSDNSLKLVVSLSCFGPSLFPSDDSSLSDCGNDQLKTLVEFYGNEQTTAFEGTTYTSPPLIYCRRLRIGWKIRMLMWTFSLKFSS